MLWIDIVKQSQNIIKQQQQQQKNQIKTNKQTKKHGKKF